MQRIPELRFSVTKSKEVRIKATLGEEPVVELALV
jgi:hypothetical protein